MNLDKVTLAGLVQCGPLHLKTWIRGTHHVDIRLDGDWVWIQNGDSKGFAHVSQVVWAVPSKEEPRGKK
jgi:hypothetical protein